MAHLSQSGTRAFWTMGIALLVMAGPMAGTGQALPPAEEMAERVVEVVKHALEVADDAIPAAGFSMEGPCRIIPAGIIMDEKWILWITDGRKSGKTNEEGQETCYGYGLDEKKLGELLNSLIDSTPAGDDLYSTVMWIYDEVLPGGN